MRLVIGIPYGLITHFFTLSTFNFIFKNMFTYEISQSSRSHSFDFVVINKNNWEFSKP